MRPDLHLKASARPFQWYRPDRPKDHSIIGGRLTATAGAAVGKTCWTIGIAQNGAQGRVWGFHFTNHPDVQVFVVCAEVLHPLLFPLTVLLFPGFALQGGLLPDDPAVAVSIRVFVGQPELDLRISGPQPGTSPGLGGIGIQPSVILVQDTRNIWDLLTTDIVFLIRQNMEYNRDVVENGPRLCCSMRLSTTKSCTCEAGSGV